jgi:apolipoprotein N-acyltransferase
MAIDTVASLGAATPVARFCSMLAGLRGWRRIAAAIGLGLAAVFAMPPFHIVPLLLPSFTGLVWLLDGAGTKRRAAQDGFFWAMGFFVPSLYWIAESMFVDIGQFWWMVPFAVLGLPAYLALYTGFATLLTHLTSRPRTISRIVVFTIAWFIGDWLRGHCLTGFPWLLPGYAWSGDAKPLLAVLQTTSLFGVYGLSLFTVLVAALPAALGSGRTPLGRYLPVGMAGLMLASALVWGLLRLDRGIDPDVPGVVLRIVSTDMPHRASSTRADLIKDFRDLISLSEEPGLDRVTAEIWPEGVVETELNLNPAARDAIADAAPPHGLVLTGTIRGEGSGPTEMAWNSIAAVNKSGAIVGSYDKHHLVPFGEYVPLHRWLNFSQIAQQRFDFSTGPGPQTLDLPGLPPVAPIICYEAIFPGEVAAPAHPAAWMVNVTDDGWFGESIGPAQHFAIARVRAVEQGIPLIRAANGGISGVIDSYGRRVATLPQGSAAILDAALPASLTTPTLFTRLIRHSIGWILR